MIAIAVALAAVFWAAWLVIGSASRDPSVRVPPSTSPEAPPSPSPEPPPADPPQPAAIAAAVRAPPVILDDLGLDEVLEAAAEPARRPAHPVLHLAGVVAGSGILLAGAILLAVKALEAFLQAVLR